MNVHQADPKPTGWHLAELNIARLRAPMDDPATKDFAEALDQINELAESSPGFLWRMQTEDGNATAIKAFDDELVITNLSVWESVEALGDYVYRSGHVAFLRRKREWFERYGSSYMVLWWVPAGEHPSIADALERLSLLDRVGVSAEAFTFGKPFPRPDTTAASHTDASHADASHTDASHADSDDRNACPA